ncbi:hypothetical protein AB0F77_24475 [Streptomyces sp. NPDC026672]|uniref:hypothetical protein n=1 Tax=unclassified Streptomyces TaxID=2593676 RepID=UPI0033CD7462
MTGNPLTAALIAFTAPFAPLASVTDGRAGERQPSTVPSAPPADDPESGSGACQCSERPHRSAA